MSKIKLTGNASGTGVLTVTAPNTDENRTISLPDETGTVALGVGIDDNADATAITIDSSENVGIGTTSVLSPLHVASATADADGALGSQSPQMILQGGTGNQNNRFEFGMDNSGGTAIAFLQSRNTVSGVQHLSLNPKGGNVGIGTTSPSAPLEVNSNTNAEAINILGRAADDISEIAFYEADTTTKLGELQYRQDHINFRHRVGDIRFAAGGVTERMRIDSSGNVGIGGTPGDKLDVFGGVAMFRRSDVNSSGAERIVAFKDGSNTERGSIKISNSAVTYTTGSDYRLKENVVPMTGSIDRLKSLKPSRFNFIINADTTVDGFLAHEVSDTVPEAISGEKDAFQIWEAFETLPEGVSVGDNKLDDGNKIPQMQTIDQSKLVPLLTSALQEAVAKIEELTTRIETLEAN